MSKKPEPTQLKPMRPKKKKKKPPHNIYHPYYWPTWLGLGAMRLLTLLPVAALGRLGDGLGMLLWALVSKRRHIVRTNIELGFADWPTNKQRELERRHFRSASRGMLEGALAWWTPGDKLSPYYTIEGLENLEKARRYGRGVILLMPHYTSMEMCGKIIGLHVADFYPTYKPAKDAAFNAAMLKARSTGVAKPIASENMRAVLKVLKDNHVVSYSPDQDFGRESSVFAPFMGVQTSTLTVTARIARASAAPVVPLHCQRLAGNRWHVRLDPPLADFPSGDDHKDAASINAIIEEQVRRAPEQYLWLHRRFKTRPDPTEPSPY
ncbi:lipid A biosynthesis acyltransferase [Halorhodospira halochloris]|uniref:lysophospholipid acyltransferase family protein n=1 Tax=Halorhodospira halochloris TaxID=1052 RepID=UPI003084111B|nr:lipid A biosynthesis acyltransferase [Halorhodospira halochloris]